MTDPEVNALDSCIKCSICTAHCPVARVTDRFAGPKQNGPDLERFRLWGLSAVSPSIDYCANCKNCDVACPSGVGVSAMNCRAKAELASDRRVPVRDRLLARVGLTGKLSSIAPSLANRAGKSRTLRIMGERLLGISADMTLPLFARRSFHSLFKARKQFSSSRKVVYFPGCHVSYSRPEVGMAVVDILQRNGIQVLNGDFGCCGLPLIAGGMLEEARVYARRNLESVKEYFRRGIPVITSCPSCSLSLRREYSDLFGGDFSGLGEMVADVFEFLIALRQEGKLDADFRSLPVRAGYHQPCHLKAAGCGSLSWELLHEIPGFRVVDLNAGCCGLAGSYGFKKEKYLISMEIGRDLFGAVREGEFDLLLTECGMCRLQILHGAGVEAFHPVELLARAYGSD